VLLVDVLQALRPADGEVMLDGTFGQGGYTRAILDAARTKVIAIDRDPSAIAVARELEAQAQGRLIAVEGRFGELDRLAREAGFPELDGVVLDIGVSSVQLDEPERGFSFRLDGPLDMRMGQEGLSAADLVNGLEERDLAGVIAALGEERRARAVARAIARARAEKPIERTLELSAIVERAVPPRRPGEIHPATRTFQALRILVNRELDELADGLAAAERALRAGGRLAVVTFHSLEDRIVKLFLADRSGRTAAPSRHLPRPQAAQPTFEVAHPRPVLPGEAETAANPRARSAKLRSAVRTSAPPRPLDRSVLGMPRLPAPALSAGGI